MMTVIVIFFSMAAIFLSIMLWVDWRLMENHHSIIYMIIFCLAMVAWGSVSGLLPKQYEYTELNVTKVNSADVLVQDGNMFNLNLIFKKSFPEESKVYFKQIVPGWYGGMYYKKTYYLRQISLEKPEDLVYNNSTE